MIAIYAEGDIIDNIALFTEDYPQWSKILNSGIDICLNIDDNKLSAKLSDVEDPICLALQGSGSMKTPIALDGFFKQINEDISIVLDKPRSIFLLNIEEEESSRIQLELGMAVYSVKNLPKSIFSNSYFIDLNKGLKISDSWKGIIKFDKPLSNALVISDNYYFTNEDIGLNRGISNLIPFLDAYLPNSLAIEYHVTIITEDSNKSNEWWVKEFGKLVAKIRNLRVYPINLELVLSTTIHPRKLISNYINGRTDQGFDVFHARDIEKIRFDNEFEQSEIFYNIDNSGTKHFQSVTNTLNKLEKKCVEVSEYVKNEGNKSGRMLFGCNNDKTIKNRLLN